MVRDMTKGSPWRLILLFSIPMLIGNIFQQLYIIIDTIIVGRYIGVEALAAVGSTGAISFLIIGFVQGVTSGFTIVTAQRFGAGDEDGVRKSVAMSIVLCLLITIVLTILSIIFTKPLLIVMKTPNNIISSAYIYIIIIFAGIGPIIYNNLIAGILRALGDSSTPLYFMIFSSFINIALDLIFILYLHMNVDGAALATVISQLLSAVFCTVYALKHYEILKFNINDFQYNNINAKIHLKVGLPMAFQFSITAVGVMVIQIAINSFGADGVAGFTAGSKIEMFVTQPFIALGASMATYCGQNRGAGRIDRIRAGMKACMLMSMIACIGASSMNIFCGKFIIGLFLRENNEHVIRYAQSYLNVLACFYPALGILYIFRNSMQGMGEAFIPFMGGVGEFFARIVVAIMLPQIIGFMAVCISSPLAWLIAIIPLIIKYVIVINKKGSCLQRRNT
jgi:putative MATE family efflux protein